MLGIFLGIIQTGTVLLNTSEIFLLSYFSAYFSLSTEIDADGSSIPINSLKSFWIPLLRTTSYYNRNLDWKVSYMLSFV